MLLARPFSALNLAQTVSKAVFKPSASPNGKRKPNSPRNCSRLVRRPKTRSADCATCHRLREPDPAAFMPRKPFTMGFPLLSLPYPGTLCASVLFRPWAKTGVQGERDPLSTDRGINDADHGAWSPLTSTVSHPKTSPPF